MGMVGLQRIGRCTDGDQLLAQKLDYSVFASARSRNFQQAHQHLRRLRIRQQFLCPYGQVQTPPTGKSVDRSALSCLTFSCCQSTRRRQSFASLLSRQPNVEKRRFGRIHASESCPRIGGSRHLYASERLRIPILTDISDTPCCEAKGLSGWSPYGPAGLPTGMAHKRMTSFDNAMGFELSSRRFEAGGLGTCGGSEEVRFGLW